MTPEGLRKKRRTREWKDTRQTKKAKMRDEGGEGKGKGRREREKEYDVPPGNGFSLLTASLKRGIINISFLQIVPDMQDTSALRAQEDIASDI